MADSASESTKFEGDMAAPNSLNPAHGTDKVNYELFISYSRRDQEFVQKLWKALQVNKRTAWVDWDAIPPNAEWRQEISDGIIAGDTFLFIISPNSLNSIECGVELKQAIKLNKRLLPILRKDVDAKDVHPSLSALNWIYFRDCDDFNSALQTLSKALDTDLEHVRLHTRLLRAAIEWEKQNRDESWLMRGSVLERAEQWLADGRTTAPHPTELQQEYVITSRLAETARQKTDARRQQLVLASVTLGLIVSSVLGLVAFQQYRTAEEHRKQAVIGEINALRATSEAMFTLNREFDALIQGLRTARLLKQASWAQQETRNEVLTTFGQAVYRVREQNRLEGHIDWVGRVRFRFDGQLLASASGDKTIKLWKPNGQLVASLKGHQGVVRDISFSPDGQMIASASNDKTVKLWQLDGTVLKTLNGHKSGLFAVDFSPDGQTIASGDKGGTVILWSRDGHLLRRFKAHNLPVYSVRFTSNGKTLATASGDGMVKLWTPDGKLSRTLVGHSGIISEVSFSHDNQVIATASVDNTVKLWKRDGTLLKTFNGHTDAVYGVAFSPDDQIIASSSGDKTVKLWRQDGTLLGTLLGHTSYVRTISAVQTSPVAAAHTLVSPLYAPHSPQEAW